MDTPNLARAHIECSQEPKSRDSEHSILDKVREYGPIPILITPDDAQSQGVSNRVFRSGIGAISDLFCIETVLRKPRIANYRDVSAAATQPRLVKSWFCVFLLVPMYIGTTFECFYMSNSQFGHILSCGPGPRPTYPGNYPVGART